MARTTLIFIFILSLIVVFIFGIKVGIKMGLLQATQNQDTNITISSITPTVTLPSPTPIPPTPDTQNISYYEDKNCGFSLSFPSSYLSQKTQNEQSVIMTDPMDKKKYLVFTCLEQIPRPPLTADKIEAISMDGQPANLYHDQDADSGNPRDEVIVKNPTNGKEIFIAGNGEVFDQAVKSFKFIGQ